ncbi:Type II restriction endonuclease HpaII [Listeria weihenstephanensis FSL R9-0317]|uniref:Restriction endonuclease HpaII n=1 Tax=Listeria weihenstephanensis TaxID=1006155 RepID=A0A1S7FXD4_9LIST|nr:HpaII family restriction endonuclease [Listeria weihenstephanensis]AQY52088.1 hypothetical protein UE46_14380 [Listeria weihenstephanensis]EUJ36014.1 Type II restriction endonuclease HpaII [Listeria weihenstephanensis FSL R9-0317]
MKGNKGEWSELYVFLKLLGDGKLYAADENMKKIEDIFYGIIKIIREDKLHNLEYVYDGEITIVDANTDNTLLVLPDTYFKSAATKLLQEIKLNKNSFEIPEISQLAQNISYTNLKANSSSKTDITLMIHDYKTGFQTETGFSIKSRLGSPATLLNASRATNFEYKISNKKLSNHEVMTFNNISNFKEKFQYLNEIGADIMFNRVCSKVFEYNLKLVDTGLPEVIASLLKKSFSSSNRIITDLTHLIAEENVFSIPEDEALTFYSYKVKELLTNIALGMVPAKNWNGVYETTGGYIIVKEDGDVLCYHVYNRNEFRDYLFLNTKLEVGSTNRHEFGLIEEIDGEQFLNLNLQIRFTR